MRISVFYEHLREASQQTDRPISEMLGEAHDCGINGIEIEFSVLLNQPSIREDIVASGLEISNMYQFFDFGNNYEEGLELGKKMIDYAAENGIKRIMPIPGFLVEAEAKKMNAVSDDYEKLTAYFENNSEVLAMKDGMTELCKYATEKGVSVSIEDFDDFKSPIARINQIKWFVENVPGLTHTLDMGNYAFSNEDVEEAYNVFKGRITHVHCKDRGEETETDKNIWDGVGVAYGKPLKFRKGLKPVPVGSGYIPIEKLVKELLKEDYDGYFAVEHFGSPDQLGFMKKSADFMKSIS
ncbi:MAG: sugar phosphate isomerase/epimerase [Lachnospiraceae bacterium]|nr:sugar phosphate isomerase/epimerase [Lachnospiraceae bacterium]